MMFFQPGDKIIHRFFGKGVVISAGDFLEIHFDSAGRKKLVPEWVEVNCKVIKQQKGTDSENKKAEKAPVEDVGITEDPVKKIMEDFLSFNLTEYGLREIEDFLNFKLNYASGHKKKLRYNLLIRSQNDKEAVALLKQIEDALKTLNVLPKKVLIQEEKEFNDGIPASFPKSYSLLGLHNCYADKENFWKKLQERMLVNPECTIIAVGSKNFIDHIRENDDLYYRFFAHRIFIYPMTIEQIIAAIYRSIADEDIRVSDEFKKAIERYIQTVYPKADLRDMEFVDDLLNRILVSYHLKPCAELTEEHVPFYRKPKTSEEIFEQLNRMIGLEKVKQQFKTIYELNNDPHKVNKKLLHFAFVGNPGTGKTTVARMTADLLYSMGLIRRNKLISVAPTDVVSQYIGESAQWMKNKINEAKGGVLFIDEAYFLTSDPTDLRSHAKQSLEVLLQEMDNMSDDLTVIFAGYQEEIKMLLGSNPGLKDRVPYTFVFEDYTTEELFSIFMQLADREEISLAADAHELLMSKIESAKTEENFGNARAIANIYQQLKAILLESKRTERVITAEVVRASLPTVSNDELNEMVGLESIKQSLKSFESRVKYIKLLKDRDITIPAFNLHMMFTGNPGTGKTTVAKMVADCLYQAGVLKTNKLVVAERKDLVGQHIGSTALKANKLIKRAMNALQRIYLRFVICLNYSQMDNLFGPVMSEVIQ